MLYVVLKSLLTPPGILILMLIVGFLLVRGVLGRLFLFTATALLLLMSLPGVATRLIEPLEPYPALGTAMAPIPSEAQAIVVLGAGRSNGALEYGGDTVDDASLRRVRYGAILYRRTGLPVYVTGGSPPPEAPPVGALMADVLRDDYSVPVTAVESASQTTWENAAYLAPMLARQPISHILLVSDAWHLPRAVEVFEATGLIVTPAPTGFVHASGWMPNPTYRDWLPSARAFYLSYLAIHEHLGRVWYQIRAWFEGPPTVPG